MKKKSDNCKVYVEKLIEQENIKKFINGQISD